MARQSCGAECRAWAWCLQAHALGRGRRAAKDVHELRPVHHGAPGLLPQRATEEAQATSGCAVSVRDALAQEVFGALASGGSLVVVAPGGEKDTQHLARVCRRHSVTCLCLVPSQLEALLRVRPRILPRGLL